MIAWHLTAIKLRTVFDTNTVSFLLIKLIVFKAKGYGITRLFCD